MDCCEQMQTQLNWDCDMHDNKYDCPDCLISYYPAFDEYGLIIHDGGSSSIIINYCPWCGSGLPKSKRDLWFETLEKIGFDEPFSQDIPEEFKSDKWYK